MAQAIGLLDWVIIGIYLCGLILFSYYLSRWQFSRRDYYVGNHGVGPWQIALSTFEWIVPVRQGGGDCGNRVQHWYRGGVDHRPEFPVVRGAAGCYHAGVRCIGGIKGVIYSDVMQILILVGMLAGLLGLAFYVGDIAETVLEAINIIDSLINGPVLAVFALGLFTRRAGGTGADFTWASQRALDGTSRQAWRRDTLVLVTWALMMLLLLIWLSSVS